MAEVYAGFISYTDHEIGRLIDYLEESGQLDNTIIVISSDNGASAEGGPNGTFNENKFFNNVPDTAEANLPKIDQLGDPNTYNHYSSGWAWAFDTPFPYWKRNSGYEGGVCDPFSITWPAGIEEGSVRHQYVHAVDLVPTLYELLGVEPPAYVKGHPQSPIEGESFAATLSDGVSRDDRVSSIRCWDSGPCTTRAGWQTPCIRRSRVGATSTRTSGSCSIWPRIAPSRRTSPPSTRRRWRR